MSFSLSFTSADADRPDFATRRFFNLIYDLIPWPYPGDTFGYKQTLDGI
jgi:hypothetical protein